MKKLENRSTELMNGEEKVDYAFLAKSILDNPPKGGWEPSDMKLSIKIENKLEKSKIGDIIELEDTEFEYLYKRAQPENMRWAKKHKDIYGFTEYLDAIK